MLIATGGSSTAELSIRYSHLMRGLHNFRKWARPAYEQGALPTLSILPGDVTIKVLPGDKMYRQ